MTPPRPRATALAAVGAVAVLVGLPGCRAPAAESASAPPSAARAVTNDPTERPRDGGTRGGAQQPPRAPAHHTSGAADGHLPDGVTVFDDSYPAVTRLDPALLRALRTASTDAARAGVTLHVNSGWRSPEYQEQLLDAAVSTYGSRAAAARWVATPATSPHVSGDAVDLGGADATTWLSRHGAGFGLCQVFENEPWHYELRPQAAQSGCPARYADPSHDPRMRS